MTDRPIPSGTIAFLFTDIEGSTKSWQAHGAVMGQAVARHDDLMRQAIAARHGHVFKTIGDAFCAAFETTGEALAAAIDAQRAMAAEPWAGVDPIRVRMAIHVGAVEEREDDYFGPPVNRVARLLSAGYGGQLLLSLPAAELLHDALPPGIGMRDLGEHRLKDLDRAEHIYQAVIAGLPSDFGPLKTVDARPNNLPLELTPFVGRVQELAQVLEALDRPEVRLLTLMGPGGIGKTRLSLQAAAELIDEFPDGAFFVPLASITDVDLVVPAIADALLVREVAGQPLIETLRDHLRRSTLLLVLDNFEQIEVAAPIVAMLLRDCPKIKIIVTSRAVLKVSGEYEIAVPTLSLPPATHDGRLAAHVAMESDAVRLFATRAQAVNAGFDITNENAAAVAEICRRLDGLPLAIELAAARVRMLTPQAMLPRLESRLKLLTGGGRDLPERQQTLRGAIAWSYDLLPPDQRTLLARMSVFSRGATFEAAESVCAGFDVLEDPDSLLPPASVLGEVDVFEGIGALVDHSLLRQEVEYGEARFTMLETIREFGLEQLTEAGVTPEVRRRHALHFLYFAERTGEDLFGAKQVQSIRNFDAEHDNLRAALSWALEGNLAELALRYGRALDGYWQTRGVLSEGRNWLERILSQSGHANPTLRARVLNNLGNLANDLCDYDRARSAYEESLAVWRAEDNRHAMATVLNNLGQVAGTQGDYTRARELHSESLSIVRELDDRRMLSLPLHNLGVIAHHEGNFTEARTYHEEALEIRKSLSDISGIAYSTQTLAHVLHHMGQGPTAHDLFEQAIGQFRDIGDRVGLAHSLTRYAEAAREAGRDDEASACLIEALTIWREIGASNGVACLEEVAMLAADHRRAERAVTLFSAAEAIRRQIGEPMPPVIERERGEMLELLQLSLGAGVFDLAWNTGKALEPEAAIAIAIAEASFEVVSA